MDCDADCKLVCSHSFCSGCVKEWYMKGNSTCPMCRKNICFRGFTHAVNKWRQEKEDQQLTDVFSRALDYILEENTSESGSDYESGSDSESESDGEFDDPPIQREVSPEPRLDEEESEWSDTDSEDFNLDLIMTEVRNFLQPRDKMKEIMEMQKKFNNLKDEYDPEDLLEIIVHPYYMVYSSKEPLEYDVNPDDNVFVSKQIAARSITGLSQKRRRALAQTPEPVSSLIQLLLGQLVLVM